MLGEASGWGFNEGEMHSLFGVIIVLGFEGDLPGFRLYPVFEGSTDLPLRLDGAMSVRVRFEGRIRGAQAT
jgi:hypothetical protein